LDEPELVEPELEEPAADDPEFDDPEGTGVDDPAVLVVPGNVPHGEPLGLVPGVFKVFGFTVEGCVLVPGVAGFVEFEPGTVDPEPGVAVPAGGVAE
jgi:hypothetical protein